MRGRVSCAWVAKAIGRDAASCTWNTSGGEITVR